MSNSVLFDETTSLNITLKGALPDLYKTASKQKAVSTTARVMAHSCDQPVMLELVENIASNEMLVGDDDDSKDDIPVAPILKMAPPLKKGCVSIGVSIDTLALVHWNSTLSSVAVSLKESICAQLRASKPELLWQVLDHY